ncbi:unnamed protein product, partial [Sphagnum compactum]
ILTSDEEEELDFFRSGNGPKSKLVRAARAFHYQTKWSHGCRQENQEMGRKQSRHDFVPDSRSRRYASIHSRPIDRVTWTSDEEEELDSDEEEELDFDRSGNGSKSNLVRAATAFEKWSHGCRQENQEMGRKQSRHDVVPDLRSHGSRNGPKSNLVRAARAFHSQTQQNQEMGGKQSRHDVVPDLRSHGFAFIHSRPIDRDIVTSDDEEEVDLFRMLW